MTTTPGWRTKDTSALFEAVLTLRTEEEAAAFFRGLCTLRELIDLSHRWAVVRLLELGHNYRQIAQDSFPTTATITRINQWLNHGAGGYRLVLDRLQREKPK